jgi:hypothetical protein
MSSRRIDAKFPVDEGVKYYEDQLNRFESWLHYLCDDEDDDVSMEGQAPLMQHFESTRQDISDLLDFILKPKPVDRPDSARLVQLLHSLRQKYITSEEEEQLTGAQVVESEVNTTTADASNDQVGADDHDTVGKSIEVCSSIQYDTYGSSGGDNDDPVNAVCDLEPPKKTQRTGEESDTAWHNADE